MSRPATSKAQAREERVAKRALATPRRRSTPSADAGPEDRQIIDVFQRDSPFHVSYQSVADAVTLVAIRVTHILIHDIDLLDTV
jgi:hypothetical protein